MCNYGCNVQIVLRSMKGRMLTSNMFLVYLFKNANSLLNYLSSIILQNPANWYSCGILLPHVRLEIKNLNNLI